MGGTTANLLVRIPELLPPLLLGVALDALFFDHRVYRIPGVPIAWISGSTIGQCWLTIRILIGAYLLYAVLDWLSSRWFGYFVQWLQQDLRTDTDAEVQRRDMAYFENNQIWEVMAILNNDVNHLGGFFYRVVSHPASLVVMAIVALGYMIQIS